MEKTKPSRAKRILLVVGIVIVVLAAAFTWYVNDYYRADAQALTAAADANGASDGVTVRQLSDKALAFVPDNPTAGIVFYPGGKVQPEAYAPLMERCAQQGVLCVLVKPLFNLAILDANAADGTWEQFPAVDNWAIAGHSLGGVVASDYAARHADTFSAIAFLAAYPSADLSSFEGNAISTVGTDDKVLNRDKYGEAHDKFPASTEELAIAGGNHAYFGNYGEQAGDGVATIDRAKQQEQTAAALVKLANAA